MPDINITVAHKVAVSDTQSIVCDNSDYMVHWTLDEDWSAYETKTMRTIYMDGTYTDKVFAGDTTELPVCTVPGAVQIGLFAGDIRTSRVAILRALPSVRSAAGAPEDPPKNVYDQLMELIKGLGVVDPDDITEKSLLLSLFKNAVYTADMTATIAQLETLWSGTEEPDVPVETTYAINNELINCTSSNSATSAKENAAYSTTLTANDGYTLTGGTVTITMGGADITATAYADGAISIAAVTGDVEIFASAIAVQAEAALPENGLTTYFDFRTTAYDNASSGGKTTIAPTKGSGQLFIWANNSISAQNEYGMRPANTRLWQYDQNGGMNETAFGNAFTVIQLTYGEAPKFGFDYSNTLPRWLFRPKYINTSGSTTEAEKMSGSNFNSDSNDDYNFTVFRADGATLTEIFDTSRTTYNGGDIDGFSRWLDTPYGNIVGTGDTKYCTAMAIYNRALTDTEIEAAREFMKTLEVTA